MHVIVFATNKGGSGKTTLLTNLASWWAAQNRKVHVLDLDPQQSTMTWLHLRQQDSSLNQIDLSLIDRDNWTDSLGETLERLDEQGVERVLIDTRGSDDDINRAAMLCATHIILPTRSGGYDVMALTRTLDVITRVQDYQEKVGEERVRTLIVLNSTYKNSLPARSLRHQLNDYVATLEAFHVIDEELPHSKSIEQSVLFGEGLHEYDPSSPAVPALRRLAAELEHYFRGEPSPPDTRAMS